MITPKPTTVTNSQEDLGLLLNPSNAINNNNHRDQTRTYIFRHLDEFWDINLMHVNIKEYIRLFTLLANTLSFILIPKYPFEFSGLYYYLYTILFVVIQLHRINKHGGGVCVSAYICCCR
jgi:hypothetical protein